MSPTEEEEEKESWKTAVYPEKQPEELLKLAHGFLANKYWTSDWHCKSLEDVRMTFLIISLLPKEALEYYERNEIVFFFEDFQKAGPRSVNGMPMFLSCQILNQNEFNQVREFMKEIKEKDQTILEGGNNLKYKTVLENIKNAKDSNKVALVFFRRYNKICIIPSEIYLKSGQAKVSRSPFEFEDNGISWEEYLEFGKVKVFVNYSDITGVFIWANFYMRSVKDEKTWKLFTDNCNQEVEDLVRDMRLFG